LSSDLCLNAKNTHYYILVNDRCITTPNICNTTNTTQIHTVFIYNGRPAVQVSASCKMQKS